MSKKNEIEIPEGKVAEWKTINGVTTMVAVDEADNRQLQKRIKTKRFVKSAEEIKELLSTQRVIYWKDERYRVQPDLFGTLSIIPVDDGPMVVFTDKQLSECYVLDEAKDEI